MKNHKQLLADFYLALLAIPANSGFRLRHQELYADIRDALSYELSEDKETIQNIFERMAAEDVSYSHS